jgi:GH43 family beta-xylosidase
MSDPETISGPRVLIDEPIHAWQQPLLEGPQVIQHAGRTFVVYSANGSWGPDYQLGMLGIDGLQDPLNPANWYAY